MICKMASKADVLDVVVASTVQKDMAIMIEDEKALRETVRKLVRFLEVQFHVINCDFLSQVVFSTTVLRSFSTLYLMATELPGALLRPGEGSGIVTE